MKFFQAATTKATSSEEIVRTGKVDLLGQYDLNINGDERFPRLAELVRQEIAKNGWKIPENEQQIAEKTVSLVHSKEFFGKYNGKLKNLAEKVTEETMKVEEVKERIEKIEAKHELSPRDKSLIEVLEKKQEKLEEGLEKVQSEYDESLKNLNSVANSKDIKMDKAVCREEAAAVSYALDKNGIKNDYISGVKIDGIGGVAGHAFVQSRVTGSIIEATDPKTPYLWNKNGAIIANHEIVISVDKSGEPDVYGAGTVSRFSDAVEEKAEISQNLRESAAKFREENTLNNQVNGFSKEVAQLMVHKALVDADKGSGLFGATGKAGDGKLSSGEAINFLEKQGVHLSEQDKKDIKVMTKDGVDITDAVKKAREVFADMDKNHNGKIDGKELQNYEQSMKMVFADSSQVAHNSVPKAQVVQVAMKG